MYAICRIEVRYVTELVALAEVEFADGKLLEEEEEVVLRCRCWSFLLLSLRLFVIS